MKAKAFGLILLAALIMASNVVQAQEKTDEQKREEMVKKELEKMMHNQYDNMRRLREEQIQIQKDFGEQYQKAIEEIRKYGGVQITTVNPNHFLRGFSPLQGNWNPEGGSSLNISKNLEGLTHSTSFTYQVKEGDLSIGFSARGTLTEGELVILLSKPDDEVFQEITISPLADVNWNQQFRWKAEDQDEFIGSWTITIEARSATGHYSLRVNSR
ncbi:MAG: hypothetical protein PHN67_09100 [Bacteroidales bacterium]|nr:hypothetical protein [Bacteroidales bacterium]